LNIFQIKNHRITYHYKYNTIMKIRLITWLFEYINLENGEQIQNIYRHLPNVDKKQLFCSTHWQLYPEEYKIKKEQTARFNKVWDRAVLNTLNTSQQFNGNLTEVNISEGYIK
jgi:hypothetical protein